MRDIQWRAWSDEAFNESRRTGKPVLLSISAVWCHWCHVMDETSYSNPAVVKLINEHFIPVRVDNDRNPDINARYNMGGWPTTAFLTPDRDVIAGATYVPPDQMANILRRVATAYDRQSGALAAQAREAREDGHTRLGSLEPREVGLDDARAVLASVRSGHDREHGGFGFDQKFPFADALALLLASYEQMGEQRDLSIATHTLESMIRGEMFDPVEGGMFRYATRRNWTEPHYEKILGDNARIAVVLLDAYRIVGNWQFLDTARGIFRYAENTLMDPGTGLFAGSQDAAEAYYKANADERARMQAPTVDSAAYVDSNADMAIAYLRLWGVAKDPSARNRALALVSLLNRLQRGPDGTVAHYYEDGAPHGYGILADHAGLLLANVECHEATGDAGYLDTARGLADSLLPFRSPAGGMYDISNRRASEQGLDRVSLSIDDSATAAIACAKLAGLTGDATFGGTAREALNALAGQYEDFGIMAARYATALMLLSQDPVVITVRASKDDPRREEFLMESMSVCNTTCTVRSEDALEDEEPAATICVGASCLAHLTDPGEIPDALAGAVRRE